MRHAVDVLKRLHRDERGAEGLEKLLIVAAIVLPLLGLLIIFRNEIKDWVVDLWKEAKGDADQNKQDFFGGKLN
jgi:Flp pilus assembly pilin Flp